MDLDTRLTGTGVRVVRTSNGGDLWETHSSQVVRAPLCGMLRAHHWWTQ